MVSTGKDLYQEGNGKRKQEIEISKQLTLASKELNKFSH